MTTKHAPAKQVRALFNDSTVLFDLPEAATLEELAAILAAAAQGHGAPLKVEVSATGWGPPAG